MSSSAASPRSTCRSWMLPVSLAEGSAMNETVAGELCMPADRDPMTMQVLVPGFTYGGIYWDFPASLHGGDRRSYVASAVAAGFATLRYDRLGSGGSTKPPSELVTVELAVWVLHQIISALRAGRSETGGHRFDKVVTVGHSFGSAVVWLEASRYHDVDGVIITGASHDPTDAVATGLLPALYTAESDPRFVDAGLDAGYVTTRPGARRWFHAPGDADEGVIAYDEATKETGTLHELMTVGQAFAEPLDITVPVLVAAGEHDQVLQPAHRGSPETLAVAEAPHLGPSVPRVDGHVLAGAGHALNLMPNASEWFDRAGSWIHQVVEGNES